MYSPDLGTGGLKVAIVKSKIQVNAPRPKLGLPCPSYCHLFHIFLIFAFIIVSLLTYSVWNKHNFNPRCFSSLGYVFELWNTCCFDHFHVNQLLLFNRQDIWEHLWRSEFTFPLVGKNKELNSFANSEKHTSGSNFSNCSISLLWVRNTFKWNPFLGAFWNPSLLLNLQTTGHWKIAPIVSSWIFL